MKELKEAKKFIGDDQPVRQVYVTYDYDKFKIIPQNRGRSQNHGLIERKIQHNQELIERDEFIESFSRVKVNLSGEIIDGRHTFETRKRNGMAIEYEIEDDERFNNGATRRDIIGAIHLVNINSTRWTGDQLFQAAVECKAPLALEMKQVIERHGNVYKFTDLFALLTQNESYFIGNSSDIRMASFTDPKLLRLFKSNEFHEELKFFVKLNLKARAAYRKGTFLKAAYLIINKAKKIVDVRAFRKYIVDIPDSRIEGKEAYKLNNCIKIMIKYINTQNGRSYEASTVLFEIKNNLSLMKKTKPKVEEEEEILEEA